jgi:hypothetical protein
MTCRPRSSSRVTPLNAYDYRAVHESLRGIIRLANSANVWRLRKCGRLSVENTLLERLAQDLENMAAELGQFIQEEHAVVGQRHLAGHRHLTPADQPHVRDGAAGGAERAWGDQRRTVARAAGDAVEARGLEGFGDEYRRQTAGQPPRQPRRVRP